jgi:3-mercaptopyruvate sulfurtransferase SseA
VALQLRKHGIRHVRPLLGGFHEWKALGFPLVEIDEARTPSPPPDSAIAAEGRA